MAENVVLIEDANRRAMQCGALSARLKATARELHDRIGVDVAVAVISERGQVYQEAHPNMDQVLLRLGYERIDEDPMVKFRRDHGELNEVVVDLDREQFLTLEILALGALHAIKDAEEQLN